MFEKWKEKRALEKQQQAARLRAAAEKFVNDVLNPNSYVDCYSRRSRDRHIVTRVVTGHENEIDQKIFSFKRYGKSVLVKASIGVLGFEKTYDLGSSDLETFLSNVCCIFDRRDLDGKDTFYGDNYRWKASYNYYRGSSYIDEFGEDYEKFGRPDATGSITLHMKIL